MILFFAEDPGAANFIAPVARHFREKGISVKVICAGSACTHFRVLGEVADCNEGEIAESIFRHLSPSLLVVGTAENPQTLGLQLIDEANRQSVPSVAVVDGPAMPERRFRGISEQPLSHAPDWIVVPNSILKRRFEELGHPPAQVFSCGHPHIDRVRKESERLQKEGRSATHARVFPAVPSDQPVIIFLAEISDGLKPSEYRRSDDYTLVGTSSSDYRSNIILEEWLLATGQMTTPFFSVLRLHPKNDVDEFTQYRSRLDLVSQGGEAWSLLYAADLVVGMSSILMVEAVVLGTPTLSILPRKQETAWLNTIDTGATSVVYLREQILPAIKDQLSKGHHIDSTIEDLFPRGAVDRLARFLSSLS